MDVRLGELYWVVPGWRSWPTCSAELLPVVDVLGEGEGRVVLFPGGEVGSVDSSLEPFATPAEAMAWACRARGQAVWAQVQLASSAAARARMELERAHEGLSSYLAAVAAGAGLSRGGE